MSKNPLIFQRSILLPFSGLESKPRKILAKRSKRK
jgi:hypothetical protein